MFRFSLNLCLTLSIVSGCGASSQSAATETATGEAEQDRPAHDPPPGAAEVDTVYCIRVTEALKAGQETRTALPRGYKEQATNDRCYGHFDSVESAKRTAAAFFSKKPDDASVVKAVEKVDGAKMAHYLMIDAPMLISLGYLWGVDVAASEPADTLVIASYPSLEGEKVVGEMIALSGRTQRVERHQVWDFSFTPKHSNLVFGKVFSWDGAEGEKPGSWLPQKISSKELERLSFAYDGMSERVALTVVHHLDPETGKFENLQSFGGTEFFETKEGLYSVAQPMLSKFCDDLDDGERFTMKNYPYCDKLVWEFDETSATMKKVKMTRELCEAACDPVRNQVAQIAGSQLQSADGKNSWPQTWPEPRVGEALFSTPGGGMALLLAGRKYDTLNNRRVLGELYLQPAIVRQATE